MAKKFKHATRVQAAGRSKWSCPVNRVIDFMSGFDGRHGERGRNKRLRWRAPLLLGMAVIGGVLIAPAVGNAFSNGARDSHVSLAARGAIGSFTPASVDPRLLGQITVRALSHAQMFRFTPAGSETRPDRSVTVAVRIDRAVAQAISVRSPLALGAADPGVGTVRIAPTGFNLGLAHGYQSFASGSVLPKPAPQSNAPDYNGPDFGGFDLATKLKPEAGKGAKAPARFAPRIELDPRDKAGKTPRLLDGQRDYQVDVGGSYRLSRNLNVTAGLRYTTERDTLRAQTDSTKDNQAVYVGTQFRF